MSSSNSTEISSLLVASWNILNDTKVPKHPDQLSRIDRVAYQLTHIEGDKTPDIFFCCEGSSADNIRILADKSGLELAIEPQSYSKHEWMSFAVRPSLKKQLTIKYIPFEERPDNDGFLIMELGNKTLAGIHYPDRILRDFDARNRATDRVLKAIAPSIQNPTVVMGDFNTLPTFGARKRYTELGLRELHQGKRPLFPHTEFRGVSMPHLFPSLNIDAIYASRHFSAHETGYSYASESDHPLLYAHLELIGEPEVIANKLPGSLAIES